VTTFHVPPNKGAALDAALADFAANTVNGGSVGATVNGAVSATAADSANLGAAAATDGPALQPGIIDAVVFDRFMAEEAFSFRVRQVP
jgi:hypothetical protein